MYFMYPKHAQNHDDTSNLIEKRALFKRLPGMSSLSLINPWHAARTLLNPEILKELQSGEPNPRFQRSIVDEMIPLKVEFIKEKFRPMGPMFKRNAGDIPEMNPKYFWYNKREENPASDIMRFLKVFVTRSL